MTTPRLPTAPARSFASDNAAGAHPAIMQAVVDANSGHALAYGQDPHTAACEQAFKELFDADVTTRLAFNGTGANIVALANMLGSLPGPHHAIVCTDWAHIALDETGAPERTLGTKLMEIPSPDAKLTPTSLQSIAHNQGVQHHAQPGVVSITQATELGTLYTTNEISDLCTAAHEMGMLVHLDGARIANATAALGGTREALRAFTVDAGVDVVSFGGTKNGMLGAEAVVFLNNDVAVGSEYTRKQVTQLSSKMRYLAAQFNVALADDLWIDLARHSNEMAARLHGLVAAIDGVEIGGPPEVNSLFPRLSPDVIEPLRDWCFFWDWDPSIHQVRWMSAWDTTADDVDCFASGVRSLVAGNTC